MRKTRDRREDNEGEKCKGVVRKAEKTNTEHTLGNVCVVRQRQSWVQFFFLVFCVCEFPAWSGVKRGKSPYSE